MKKITVIAVILLFIGISIAPSISGSIGELSSASLIEEVSDISSKLKKPHESDIASYDESAVFGTRLFDADNSFGKTIYVDDDGGADYTRIQDAVDNASDGDTIFVYSGRYFEEIIINKKVNIFGENQDTTIIDGEGKIRSAFILNVDKVNISHFTILNCKDSKAIQILSNFSHIANCTFTKNACPIYIHGSNNSIIDCLIFDNDYSKYSVILFIEKGDYNLIDRCTLYNNIHYRRQITSQKDGILLVRANYNIVKRCTIVHHHSAGISIYSGYPGKNNLFYQNNFILNNPNAKNFEDNIWDNGFCGNYWDDYLERYPTATQTNDIWNTPYYVGDGKYDNYPLVNPMTEVEFPHVHPLANFEYEPSTPVIDEFIKFDASLSFDFYNISRYEWDFGDDTYGTGNVITHSYPVEGTYTVTLAVTNQDGINDSISKEIQIDDCTCSVINLDTGETFWKIQSAIDDKDTENGNTLFVEKNQTCCENLVIDKSINLVGGDKNNTVIDGREKGDVIKITADWVNISGFTIRNSGDVFTSGIYIESGWNRIIGNILIDNHYGILAISPSGNNNISKNIIANNRWEGIQLYKGSSSTISYNNIINNEFAGIRLRSGNNDIYCNNVSGSDYGIYLDSGNKVYYNYIHSHKTGVFIGVSSTQIYRNIIKNNALGLYIMLNTNTNNTITENNFISNIIDATFHDVFINFLLNWYNLKEIRMNKWDGNFWDDLPRLKSHKIIFGTMLFHLFFPLFGFLADIPIGVPIFQFDWHPAREPYDIP